MIKRYVLLLILMNLCLFVGAMNIEPQEHQITLHLRSDKGVVSDESISFDIDILSLIPQLQMLWNLKKDKNDFNLLIADEYSLDTIQFVLDALQLYDSQEPHQTQLINKKIDELNNLAELFEIRQCADYLGLDQGFLNILDWQLKEKIIHFLKNRLIQKGSSKKRIVLFNHIEKLFNLVAFSSDDRKIAAATQEGFFTIDIAKDSEYNSKYHGRNSLFGSRKACFLDFFEDNQLCIGYCLPVDDVMHKESSSRIEIYNFNEFNEFKEENTYVLPVSNVLAVQKISKSLFFCGRDKEKSNFLLYGMCDNLENVQTFDAEGEIIAVAMNSLGRWIASVSLNRSKPLVLWNIDPIENHIFAYNTEYKLNSDLQNLKALAFSVDGKQLVVASAKGSTEGNMALFDIDNISPRSSISLNSIKKFGDDSAISSVVFSSDGKWIVSGGYEDSRDNIKIWDVATGKLLTSFADLSEGVNSVSLSHDGTKLLISNKRFGYKDETLTLWQLFTVQDIHGLEQVEQCNVDQLGLLSYLCSAVMIDNRNDLLVGSHMDLFNELDHNLQNILKNVVPGLVLEGKPEIITLKPTQNLPLTQPAIMITEPKKSEGWSWKQKAVITLGVGVAAAIAIVKGPEAIHKAYGWYQKWNKMKR